MKIKSTLLTIVLSFSLLGVSLADTVPSSSAVAREIANALQLNEAEYLKIHKLEKARREEVRKNKAEEEAINEKYMAAVMDLLTADQKKAYIAFSKEHPMPQIAQTK
ncbi:hypothetical protein [Rufibacter tibetensis]|uniref:DUF4890 domain-containing protein n=1 Tax=Rufibacter tibetensis TaxID=512763 RepID=A0A0P0C4D2_9BACT|nr:hypothetical protein [Rufibacter tibetensis]ALJ00002.1 hypothetical protein DC20_14730 [Rufibacter tibetensis]